jgi:molybdopterin/thiamine biosynthesis adenylyltransferase
MINQKIKEIVLTKSTVRRCIDYFRSNLPRESVVFGFGKAIEKQDGTIVIATSPVFPRDTDYESRSESRCSVSLEFMAREFPKHSKKAEKAVVSWHAHPIDGLSRMDENAHMEMLKGYSHILTGYYHCGKFEFFKHDGGFKKVEHRIVDMRFYDRQMRAFGLDAQFKLITTHVALIGCGGAAQLAYLLAQEGIGKLTLIDPDSWDKTSLGRVWIPRSQVGMNKAESLMKLVKRWRSTEVKAFPCAVEDLPREALEDVDVLVAMTDTFKSRINVNRLAVDMKKPAVFGGAEIRAKKNKIESMIGECIVYLPDKTPCYECNLKVDPRQAMRESMDKKIWRRFARKYGLPADSAPAPSLANLNNIIVSLISDEIMKIVTAYAETIHYQYWDHLKRKLIVVTAEKNTECPACGSIQPAEVKESDLISTEEALGKGAGD